MEKESLSRYFYFYTLEELIPDGKIEESFDFSNGNN